MFKEFLNKNRHYFNALKWPCCVLFVYSILGFFVAPWLIEKNIKKILAEDFNSNLEIEKIQVNPFSLSIRIRELSLNDPLNNTLANIDDIYLNFQLSSLFNQALTFSEFLISSPEIFISRDNNNVFNFSYLYEGETDGRIVESSENAESIESELFPILIHKLAIQDSVVHFRDEIPATPVTILLGPSNFNFDELTTLNDRSGDMQGLITTQTGGIVSWNGSIALNPVALIGHLSVNSADLPVVSAYIRNDVGLDLQNAYTELNLDFDIANDNSEPRIAISDISLTLSDIVTSIFADATNDPLDQDREILSIASLQFNEGTFLWPQRNFALTSFNLNEPVVSIFRDQAGILNILKIPLLTNNPPPEEATNSAVAEPWQISLDNFAINQATINLLDSTVQPNADISINNLNISILDFNTDINQNFSSTLQAEVESGGQIDLTGQFSIFPNPSMEFEVNISDLALTAGQPYLQAITDLRLESGDINLNGNIISNGTEPFNFTGTSSISDFSIIETIQGSKLGSWELLDIDNLALSIANSSLQVSELLLSSPYADLVVETDGSFNIGRLDLSDNPDTSPAVVTEQVATNETENLPMVITVGRVNIEGGAADFVDYSLPLPFSAQISELAGTVSTISTNSDEPSSVSFEGKVDEFGLVRIGGSLTPFDFNANTDINVRFENVTIPKFSAYMIPFAGREISSGRLDFDLGYKVTDHQLDSENNMLLREFTLGERIEHSKALSLPLDLAVALLKNSEGNIDIDLPITGDVEDPEFNYGGIIGQVFSNLIIKIVASPFTLLGNLVGFSADQMEYIEFADGISNLTPPQLEKAVKLAEALLLRPELSFEFAGVVDSVNDDLALKTLKLNAIVEARIQEQLNEEAGMYNQQRRIAFEELYIGAILSDESLIDLETLIYQFSNEVVLDNDAVEFQLNEADYLNHIQQLLIHAQVILPIELQTLANTRAENVRMAILDNAPDLIDRVQVLSNVEASRKEDEALRMLISVGSK